MTFSSTWIFSQQNGLEVSFYYSRSEIRCSHYFFCKGYFPLNVSQLVLSSFVEFQIYILIFPLPNPTTNRYSEWLTNSGANETEQIFSSGTVSTSLLETSFIEQSDFSALELVSFSYGVQITSFPSREPVAKYFESCDQAQQLSWRLWIALFFDENATDSKCTSLSEKRIIIFKERKIKIFKWMIRSLTFSLIQIPRSISRCRK